MVRQKPILRTSLASNQKVILSAKFASPEAASCSAFPWHQMPAVRRLFSTLHSFTVHSHDLFYCSRYSLLVLAGEMPFRRKPKPMHCNIYTSFVSCFGCEYYTLDRLSCLIKFLRCILFKSILKFQHWKWPAQGTGTVPVVSAHFVPCWRRVQSTDGDSLTEHGSRNLDLRDAALLRLCLHLQVLVVSCWSKLSGRPNDPLVPRRCLVCRPPLPLPLRRRSIDRQLTTRGSVD